MTEQQILTQSTQATPEAARLDVKRTERQELATASKRRAYVNRTGTKKAR